MTYYIQFNPLWFGVAINDIFSFWFIEYFIELIFFAKIILYILLHRFCCENDIGYFIELIFLQKWYWIFYWIDFFAKMILDILLNQFSFWENDIEYLIELMFLKKIILDILMNWFFLKREQIDLKNKHIQYFLGLIQMELTVEVCILQTYPILVCIKSVFKSKSTKINLKNEV